VLNDDKLIALPDFRAKVCVELPDKPKQSQ